MQNFGKIKNAFSEIMAEGIVSNDETKKNLFKKYVKTLKESEILKTQFLVYENIENKIESNREKATEFVKENIALLSKFSKKDLQEANLKIAKPILFEQGSGDEYATEKLHENISKLIFTKRTPKTIDVIVEATSAIVDYIVGNKSKVVTESYDIPNSMLSSILVEKYNERYSELTETEKEVIKVLIESTDNEKLEVYAKITRECIDLIDAKLTESDLDTKDRLLKVKDKLLRDKIELNEDFAKNISKLVDLKSTLNNNN